MADIYVKAPDGSVVVIDDSEQQRAVNSGYSMLSPEELQAAQNADVSNQGEAGAVASGALQAPAGGYDPTQEFLAKATSAATFGLGGLNDPSSVATARRFQEERPGLALAAEAAGQLPLAVLSGGLGEAAVGAGQAAGLGRAAMAGVRGADFAAQAAVGGLQTEAEQTRLAQDEFSFTDAAITGVVGEALGRGAGWAVAKGVGGARNLVARAARDVVAEDAAESLAKGGWLNDYRVAQHAEQYHNELAELAAKDLDELETAFQEVSRQDRKRGRITRVVTDDPAVQAPVRAEAAQSLSQLRDALSDELADAGGPARKLLKQLDERIAKLEDAPTGKRLWRALDENRQALQEYRQDLYQAYESNPGSAWLSREGLAAIDAAEKATREALLREDVWGEAAARMQREYNTPFHEKYFPTVKTVRNDLMFSPHDNAEGFKVFQGDPAKVKRFLARDVASPDGHRLGEQFREYLDGVEAIARAGQSDTPQAAHRVLESVRRLRKAQANAAYVSAAAERAGKRAASAEVVADVAAGAAGAAAFGVPGAVGFAGASRGLRVGHWLSKAAQKLGLGSGDALSMAKLLERDALPAPSAADRPFVDDLAEAEVPRSGPPSRGPSSTPPDDGGGEPLDVGIFSDAPPSRATSPDLSTAPPAESGVSLRPGRAERAARPTEPVRYDRATPDPDGERPTLPAGAREVHRNQDAALAMDELRNVRGASQREAKRLEALAEGEFRDIVQTLKASGEPEARELAEALERNLETLKTAGLVVAGAGAAALAAQDQPEGAAGAAVAGLALLTGKLKPLGWTSHQIAAYAETAAGKKLLEELTPSGPVARSARAEMLERNLGKSQMLGAKFWRKTAEAKAVIEQAAESLPEPYARGPIAEQLLNTGKAPPGIEKLIQVSKRRIEDLAPDERRALRDWVGTSHGIRNQQRTGLPSTDSPDVLDPEDFNAAAFESAVDKLMVLNPTQHGALHRFVDLPDEALAELLTRDDYVAGATMSSGYLPDSNFGQVELRFNRVERAGALIGLNPAEWEMLIPKDSRFKVTGRYYDQAKQGFVFELEEVPETADLTAKIGDVGYLAFPIAAAAGAASDSEQPGEGGAAGAMALFGARAGLFKAARGKLVAEVAKRLFSSTAEPAAKVAARLVYSRAQLKARQEEFQEWATNPQALVERVAEGFRDVPPEHSGTVASGVFRAASFLKERLPTVAKLNAISLRQIPVSQDAMLKFARYEQAALRPREAWQNAAAGGHVSAELLETTEELYPDLLAELRVGAIQTVQENGPPTTVQGRLAYARLFDGRGELADPAFSQTVSNMTAYAYEQAVPTQPGGGPTSSGNVSHVAAASAAPRMGPAAS